MEFTEALRCWNGTVRISPNGSCLAALNRAEDGTTYSVSLYNASNGGILRRLMGPSQVGTETIGPPRPTRVEIDWSPNSRFLVLVEYGMGQIYVWDAMLGDGSEGPLCVIRENRMLGMEFVAWAPDSRHILVHLCHRVTPTAILYAILGGDPAVESRRTVRQGLFCRPQVWWKRSIFQQKWSLDGHFASKGGHRCDCYLRYQNAGLADGP